MKKSFYYITLIGILLISVIGVSYAIFKYVIGNEDAKNMIVETGNLSLNFIDGPQITKSDIFPGWKTKKSFTVTNTGTLYTNYTIWWKEFENTIENNELVYSLTCKSYSDYNTKTEGGNCYGFEEKVMNSIDDLRVLSNIAIEVGYTHEYELEIEFKETGSAQDYNKGKRFSGTLSIKEYYENENDVPVLETYELANNTLTARITDKDGIVAYALEYRTADLLPEGLEWTEIKSTKELNLTLEVSDYNITLWLKNRAGNIVYYELTPLDQLTVDPNGGTWEGNIGKQIYNLEYEETKEISNPTREGYTFDKWTLTSEGTESTLINGLFTMGESDTTLKAEWIINTYTLTINANGGMYEDRSEVVTEVEYKSNVRLEEPVRTGYTFTGWTKSSEKAILNANTLTIGSENCILTANYVVNTYPWIAYHNKMDIGGNGYTLVEADTESGSADYGSKVTPKVKTYTGFNSPSAVELTIKETNNIVNYNYERQKYNLVINPNEGKYNNTSNTTTVSLYYEEAKTIENPTRTGYNFTNWTKSGGGKLTDNVFTAGTSESKLTANWSAIKSLVTFNSNGGNTPSFESKIIIYDEAYGELPEVSREGYIFLGWFTSASGGTQINSTDIVNIISSITLYAQWVNKFKLTINTNGGTTTQATEELYYPETNITLVEPTRSNYVFTGWTFDGNESSHTANTITIGRGETIVTANWIESSLVNKTFSYTKTEQTFTAPVSGYYKLEVWGAQGGSYNTTHRGGYGGYSVGSVYLNKNQILYINVGGMGSFSLQATSTATTISGGYNGGGTGTSGGDGASYSAGGGSGGGATHIALVSGKLSNLSSADNKSKILIVAGGGGGAAADSYQSYMFSYSGGNGGGLYGTSVSGESTTCTPGSQSSGSAFGIGGNYASLTHGAAGGGGGYYGGTGGGVNAPGCGGSGYINNSLLLSYSSVTKSMYCYNCTPSTDAGTKTVSTTNVSSTATSNYAKSGNGHAKITYIGE